VSHSPQPGAALDSLVGADPHRRWELKSRRLRGLETGIPRAAAPSPLLARHLVSTSVGSPEFVFQLRQSVPTQPVPATLQLVVDPLGEALGVRVAAALREILADKLRIAQIGQRPERGFPE
jgi:hypothetical protein